MKKRILAISCILCFALSLTVSAGAVNQKAMDGVTEEYWLMDESGLHKISYEEYLECIKTEYYFNGGTDISEYGVIQPNATKTVTYAMKTCSKELGQKKAVSQCCLYPAVPVVTTSVVTSSTYTKTTSAEAKSEIRGKVKAKIGFTVTESSTSATGSSAGATVVPKSGKYATIYFQPYIAYSSGTVTEKTLYNNGWNTNEYEVSTSHPVVLENGLTYGLYTVTYSDTFIQP